MTLTPLPSIRISKEQKQVGLQIPLDTCILQ
jgi:hypothetical protein